MPRILLLHCRDWTNEEDKLLQEAVAVYGESSWQLVAEYVGERTGQQCLFRWTKSIDPRLKKGKWSAKEDKVAFPLSEYCYLWLTIMCLTILFIRYT